MYHELLPGQDDRASASDPTSEFDPAEATPNLAQLPAAEQLRERGARFVCWRYEIVDGRQAKVPKRPSGTWASVIEPASWSGLDQCMAAVEPMGFTGVGFVLAAECDLAADWKPILCVDLDGCRNPETGEIEPWAMDIVRDFRSYTEVSPSATGLKIFFMVDEDTAIRGGTLGIRKTDGVGRNQQIEVYTTKRYCALTWQVLDEFPDEITVAIEAFERLMSRFPETNGVGAAGDVDVELGEHAGDPSPETMALIEKIPWIQELYHEGKSEKTSGDTSKSALDFELATKLGWLGVSNEEIARVLMRFPFGQMGSGKLKGRQAERRILNLVGQAQLRRQAHEAQVEHGAELVRGLMEGIRRREEAQKAEAGAAGRGAKDDGPPTDAQAAPVGKPDASLPPLTPAEIEALHLEAPGALGRFVRWSLRSATHPQPILSLGAAIAWYGTLMGQTVLSGRWTRQPKQSLHSRSGRQRFRKGQPAEVRQGAGRAHAHQQLLRRRDSFRRRSA